MRMTSPKIIQGGMGAGVSSWRLARAVSSLGQLGVVSGTGLDQILARRLQEGDPEGHIRRAFDHFPFRDIARRAWDAFYVPGGKPPDVRYKTSVMHTVEGERFPQELSILGNFVEVFLAKEGHSNPVGINYLEKIQLPHLPSLYGAMLAGVSVIIVGAGIPGQFPAAMDALKDHETASYVINVVGASAGSGETRMVFDPRAFWGPDVTTMKPLKRPDFLPIVSSNLLATMLQKRLPGAIDGFIVEGPSAGGHNAPPRRRGELSEAGEPVYGPKDEVKLESIRALGLPFWLAGNYGSPEGLKLAEKESAAGVQMGTAFALCTESGLDPEIRRRLVKSAVDGTAKVFTNPVASPTGFPFKVAALDGSLSNEDVYMKRKRICDLGFLREVYRTESGGLGYRCPAEPVKAYVAKGGKAEDTVGRRCLCNALVANIGMPQLLGDGKYELCLITLGDDMQGIVRYCRNSDYEYSAADVVSAVVG